MNNREWLVAALGREAINLMTQIFHDYKEAGQGGATGCGGAVPMVSSGQQRRN